jgi:hypothetical protein
MAATTLANLISLVGDYEYQVILHNIFTQPDPVAASIPMEMAEGGATYTQRYANPPSAASHLAIYDTMSASARTEGSYTGFMKYAYKMDDDPILLSPNGNGQQGHDRKEEKKIDLLIGVSNLFRQDLYVGAEYTAAIGANLQALFGASYAVEIHGAGSSFGFEDVNGRSGVSTVNAGFKWTQASDSLQYKAPGDTAYGPAVVLSATHRFKVQLYSGGTTGSANYAKWCRVTCTYATIHGTGNYDSDTGGLAADYVVLTPSKAPAGFAYKVSPERFAFDNLSFNTSGHATNPTAAGAAADQDNLTWATMKLLDGANGNASRCVLLADDMLYIALGGIISALGQKAETYWFMGMELHDLNFGGIRIQRCPWLPTDLTSPNGSTTTCRYLLGLVLGDDGCKVKYSTLNTDATMAALVAKLGGSQSLTDTAGTRNLPMSYYETLAAANTLVANQIAVMAFDPVVGGLDKAVMVSNLTA